MEQNINKLLCKEGLDNSGLKSSIPLNLNITIEDPDNAAFAYVFGNTEFAKEPVASDGSQWEAGLFAKLNLETGNIEWQRSHSFSNKTDFFQGGFLHEGSLYAYGIQSRVFFNDEDNTSNAFGNGILAKINPANGDLISSRTFGDASSQAGINTAFVLDDKIYMGGFSNYSGEGGSQNWFVVMNP